MTFPTFWIKQGDTAPSLFPTLVDADGTAVSLAAADSVDFHMQPVNGGTVITGTAAIVSASAGTVRYDWQAADTATAATFYAEFQVNWSDGTFTTFPNNGNFTVIVTGEIA